MKELTSSVIICTYHAARWETLLAAIDSVRRQTCVVDEIIVVVDHAPELMQQLQQAAPDIRVIANSGPQGLSGARNSGVVAASGSLLLFLDDDAIAAPDWFRQFSAALADHPDALGAAGAIVPAWPGVVPAWFPEEFLWVVGCTYRGLPTTITPVRNPIGASMLVRREVFDAVGGFRAGLGRVGNVPLGGEETELGIRAHQHWPARSFLYIPAAQVHHHVSADRTRWRYFRRRCYAEGLSKAAIARLAGADDATATERGYVQRTLPAGVGRGLRDLLRGQPAGLGRALAIILGLGFTTAGYLVGRLTLRNGPSALDPHDSVGGEVDIVASHRHAQGLAREIDQHDDVVAG